MDIGRSFSYVFEDQNWLKKVLIGGIINLIPIVNFAATGYWLEQTRRVSNDQVLPLPEWDNFGGYFMKGLMAFVAGFVYSLPAILIYCCIAFVPAMLTGAGGSNGRGGDTGPMAAIAGPLAICGACLLLLYLVVLLVFVPALFIRYALTDQFGVLFQFGPAWQLINTNVGSYVTALVVFVIAGAIASTIGSIACVIGAAFTSFWASLVGAFLFGSFARGVAAAPGAGYAPVQQ